MGESPWKTLREAGTRGDDAIPLVETALALAMIRRPVDDLDWYRRHLDTLVAAVAAEGPADDADAAAAALARVLAHQYGYRGDNDDYDDLQNANLLRVIDRRRGLPVALSILYLHVGRAQGWAMTGINFPGHFLVRLEHGGRRGILDPFYGGAARQSADLRALLKAMAGVEVELRPDHYAPTTDRELLLRLQSNIKLRLLRSGDLTEALSCLEQMMAIAPDRPTLWREAGLLHARLGHNAAAIRALERVVDLADADGLVHEATVLLQQLRTRLN